MELTPLARRLWSLFIESSSREMPNGRYDIYKSPSKAGPEKLLAYRHLAETEAHLAVAIIEEQTKTVALVELQELGVVLPLSGIDPDLGKVTAEEIGRR